MPASAGMSGNDQRQISRFDLGHARLLHRRPGGGERAAVVDAARGIVDHEGLEAGTPRIHRGPGDAEIGGKPRHEHARQPALLEIAAEPGRGLLVGFEKRRIAVDVLVVALAHDQLRMRNGDVLGNVRAGCPLHAMVRPQHLVAVGQLDHLERRLAGMRGRERDMARRVPILREHHVGKFLGDRIDDGHDLLAVLDRQAAARQEAVLHVHDDEHALVVDRDGRERRSGRTEQRCGDPGAEPAHHLTTIEICHDGLRDLSRLIAPAD